MNEARMILGMWALLRLRAGQFLAWRSGLCLSKGPGKFSHGMKEPVPSRHSPVTRLHISWRDSWESQGGS